MLCVVSLGVRSKMNFVWVDVVVVVVFVVCSVVLLWYSVYVRTVCLCLSFDLF